MLDVDLRKPNEDAAVPRTTPRVAMMRVARHWACGKASGVLVGTTVAQDRARVDVATTLSLGHLLAELAHEHGTTVVCATHDPLLIDLADDEVRLG